MISIKGCLESTDRFRKTFKLRFCAPQIADAIFEKFYSSARRIGSKEPEFLNAINGVFICLISTAIFHCLKAWENGTYDGRVAFTPEARQRKKS